MTTVGWRGVAVDLVGDPATVDAVRAQLPPFWDAGEADGAVQATAVIDGSDGSDGSDGVTVDLPDGLALVGPGGAEGHRAAASRIELFLVSRLTDLAPVHAGVVAVGGRAIVLPGTSMAGKSTLVRALLDRGATYLSDEFALLTPTGEVLPYPRLMTVRTPSGSRRVAADRAAEVDGPAFPVAVVATLRWDAEQPSTRTASASDAVLDLVANSVTVRRAPESAMSAFAATAAGAHRLRGTRGEAALAASQLLALLDEVSRS